MNIPPEFSRLGHCFLQDDYDWGVDNVTEWIKRALALTHLSAAGVQNLRNHLDELLAQSDNRALERTWWASGSVYGLRGGESVRNFLTEVRRLLDIVEIKGPPTQKAVSASQVAD